MTKTTSLFCGLLATVFLYLASGGASMAEREQDEKLRALDGEWLFVEDRTEGRAVEDGGAPMSMRFRLIVGEDAVTYPRARGDERITLDGSVIEKTEDDGKIERAWGEWKGDDGWLEYTVESERPGDERGKFVLKRVFRIMDDGLLVYVFTNRTQKQVALYRHPEDIALPEPAQATVSDVAWIGGTWVGAKGKSSIEERWTPAKGGALLGVSRTVNGEGKMVGFEYLRIVERDGGLVYVAQPGGRPPTEFVLSDISETRAVFTNPRHDYPQRIVYDLSEEGVLTASIGYAKGRLQGFEFRRE